MKFSALKFSVAGLSLLALSSVHAQSTQSGIVRFTGNISPVTCIVNLGSRDQKIDFGIVPPNDRGFTSGGGAVGNVALPAHQRTITIRLDGCSTPGANNQPTTAPVRFDGPIRNGRINTSNATTDIQLLENNSTTAIWDLSGPSAPVNLQSGTNTLNYIARYYVAAVPLASGEANAEATFTMNYQ